MVDKGVFFFNIIHFVKMKIKVIALETKGNADLPTVSDLTFKKAGKLIFVQYSSKSL